MKKIVNLSEKIIRKNKKSSCSMKRSCLRNVLRETNCGNQILKMIFIIVFCRCENFGFDFVMIRLHKNFKLITYFRLVMQFNACLFFFKENLIKSEFCLIHICITATKKNKFHNFYLLYSKQELSKFFTFSNYFYFLLI